MPADVNLLPKDQRKKIEEWCDQIPTLGFNSGTYDLNSDKEVLRRKACGHNQQSQSGKERKQNHVLANFGIPFSRHNQLLGTRNQLREMGKSLRLQGNKILVTIRVV